MVTQNDKETAEALRLEGNALFNKGKYAAAIEVRQNGSVHMLSCGRLCMPAHLCAEMLDSSIAMNSLTSLFDAFPLAEVHRGPDAVPSTR